MQAACCESEAKRPHRQLRERISAVAEREQKEYRQTAEHGRAAAAVQAA